MTRLRKLASVVLLGTTLVVLGASPGHAEAVSKRDPRGDAPPRLDITRVTYRHMPQKVAVHLVIPDLVRGGSASLFIGPSTPSDFGFYAIVRVRPDGSLQKRFLYSGDGGTVEQDCAFSTTWNAGRNFVDISVPGACFAEADGTEIWLQGATGVNTETWQAKDAAPSAYHLLKG